MLKYNNIGDAIVLLKLSVGAQGSKMIDRKE
jgi:hypothetical protein